MTRREWIALLSAAPLLKAVPADAPAAPVSIAKCATYDDDVTAKLNTMFDQLGGLERLVKNKTVTVKVNMTGSPGQRVQGLAPALTHYTHPKLIGATAHLMGRAGGKADPVRGKRLGHRGTARGSDVGFGLECAQSPIGGHRGGVRKHQRPRKG